MIDFKYPQGATPIDLDEASGLKTGHISTREELNRFEQDNIHEAIEWLKSRRNGDMLTERFVRTLHKKMFGKVWRWAGDFRRSGKNIGVDWTQIPLRLGDLLADVRYWIDKKVYAPDEIAARFHHILVSIHLFANGNGRHARLMADVLAESVLGLKPFAWNTMNIDVKGEAREKYLDGLRSADNGDYSKLLAFVRPPGPVAGKNK